MGVKCYLMVVLICICISPVTSDIGHFFQVLIGHVYLFFGDCLTQVHCPLLNWIVYFCCWIIVLSILWLLISYQIFDLNIFSLILWLAQSFKFWQSPIYQYFLLWLMLLVLHPSTLPNPRSQRFSPMFFSNSFRFYI